MSQLCCTTKLLKEIGVKPNMLPSEQPAGDGLGTWYADIFRFERRKCLLLFHPSSGYGIVAPNVVKKDIVALRKTLASLLERSMTADGFSGTSVAQCATDIREGQMARTGDRSSRAAMVSATNDAHFGLGMSVKSDVISMETLARLTVSHRERISGALPVVALGSLLDESIERSHYLTYVRRDVCQVYVEIEGIEPRIWRRLVVPSNTLLSDFHRLIQAAFGWQNYHLHLFEAGDHKFEDYKDNGSEFGGKDAGLIRFLDFLALGNGVARYTYDFGDDWKHIIRLEGRRTDDPGPVPRCIDGARSGPPEDSGGIGGYARILAVLRDPTDEDYQMFVDWLPENWNPESFSEHSATEAMVRFQKERGSFTI